MKEIIINRFIEFIQKKHMISKNEHILIGVSGGVDSVSLLNLFIEIKERFSLEIGAAHVNYGLRGEDSDKDQKLVEDICRKNNIPLFINKVKLITKSNKASIEERARDIRYSFFDKICDTEHFDKIAVAHNADDNSETVLFNLFRGSGIDGVSGIPVKRNNIIRPLIFLKREELLNYAKEKRLKFRHDKTNFEDKYSRNYIRLRILPMVAKRINPKAVENINQFAGILSEFSDFVNEYVKRAVKSARILKDASEFSLDIKKLNNYITFIREKVIISSYFDFTKETLSSNKVLKIIEIIGSQTGRKVFLKKDIVLWKERNTIIFKRIPDASVGKEELKVDINQTIAVGRYNVTLSDAGKCVFTPEPCTEYIDKDLIDGNFFIRYWKEGDYFYPFGMTGRKKVSDFLTDIKISSPEKKSVLVLTNKGKVVWIAGFRLDDRFKCTKTTKKFIKLEIKRKQ